MTLISGEDIDPACFETFSGAILVIDCSAMSPLDRKLLTSTANKEGLQNSWSRLLCAYIETLDEDTLRVVRSNASDQSLVKYQIMALLRRSLREDQRRPRDIKRQETGGMRARQDAEHLFSDVCAWVVTNLADPEMNLNFVAGHFRLSPRSIQNLFSLYGSNITFVSFLRQQRLLRAKEMLVDAEHAQQTISEISWSCGFGDPVYFGKVFRDFFGKAPGEMRRGKCSASMPSCQDGKPCTSVQY